MNLIIRIFATKESSNWFFLKQKSKTLIVLASIWNTFENIICEIKILIGNGMCLDDISQNQHLVSKNLEKDIYMFFQNLVFGPCF